MSATTVMVVDDDAELRDILCEVLEEDGYRTVRVSSGAAALAQLKSDSRKPDVILLDLMMPGMNGWQFREEQLRDSSLASIPVVVMTASRDVQGIQVDEVLYKPIKLDRLLNVVRRQSNEAATAAPPGVEERKPTQSLRESEERFRMLADNMSQLAWTCDLLGNATWYNKRWLEYTGMSFEDTKGWDWAKVQHPDHVDRVVAHLQRSSETGQPWEDTFPLRGRDGEYRWFLSRAVPVRDERGVVVQWFGTNTDITEQKLAEEEVARQAKELSALNERLQELDQLKNEFFSNISHEFRTPLTLILSPLEEALAAAEDPDERHRLELAHRNALRLHKLVNSLLDFSRIEEGRIQAFYEPLDLASLTRDLASAFRSAIERAGLVLAIDCPPLPEPIFVDRDMWEKIVLNLLSNAFKFTFEGRIDVSLRAIDGCVSLRVADTGVGVREEEVPRLFERFHRIEGTRARTHEGSGIGLALVQELTGLHGGTVHAESRFGVGTAFTVTLPRGSAHLPKDRIGAAPTTSTAIGAPPFVEEALRWLPNDFERTPPPALGKPNRPKRQARILLADDNADMRDYLRRLLEAHWTIEAVDNGATALAVARTRPPDLVMTDVMMPGLDGIALLRELRKDDATKFIPVIMLSARVGEDSRVEGLQAGAEDYLIKPFSARELLARVRSHLELSRLRNESRVQREHLYAIFAQAPIPICVFYGEDLVFEMANPLYLEVARYGDVVGKTLLDAFPEARGQGFDDLLRGVMKTGQPHFGQEALGRLDRDHDGVLEDAYFTFVYAPLRNPDGVIDRVIAVFYEVTEQVLARKKAEESEERFRRIVSQVQAGIAKTDLTGRFTLSNERYREIVGRSAAELAQLRMQDITHPDDLPANLEMFQRLVEVGTPFIIEKRYTKPDGSIVWVQNSVSRIDDRQGRPQGVAAVTIDITQRRYAERALKESELYFRELYQAARVSEARFRAIFENADVSIWEEDYSAVRQLVAKLQAEHGAGLKAFLEANPSVVHEAVGLIRIHDVNPATLRMFGASSKDELLGSLSKIFLPETLSVFTEELMALAEGRRLFSVETAVQTLTNQRMHVLVKVSFPTPEETSERVLVTITDISEREARVAEMERAVRFSEMFAGMLGHDLRSPLSAITSAAGLLTLRGDETERIRRVAGRIIISADRMERMISQLLDFTRIRLGRGLPLERGRVDLAEVSCTVIEELESTCDKDFELEVAGDACGIWDGDRLSQLVSNLGANACQHGTPGTPVKILVDGSRAEVVRLEVRNQGMIPPDLLPDIFEPLRHLDQGGPRRAGSSGLGLGLYISQQIVIAHDGTIGVDSTEGRGTRFIVKLPRHPPADSDRVFGFDASSD